MGGGQDASERMRTLKTATQRGGERGQLLPLVAVGLVALLGMTALGVDVGFWRFQQRAQQSAADSAAVTAMIEKGLYSGTAATVLGAARSEATRNGFTDDAGVTTSVTVNQTAGTVTGAYAGDPNAVEVVIAKKSHNLFAGGLGFVPPVVRTRSVGVYNDAAQNCIIGLNKTAYSVYISGTNISVPTCRIASDGSFKADGSNIDAKGINYTVTSSTMGSNVTINGSAGASPTAFGGIADPCPSITACAYLKATPQTGPVQPSGTRSGGNFTLQPGEYQTQLVISGSNVTFAPGEYIFDNGVSIMGSNIASVNNITFINKAGKFDMQGSNASFTAPSTGLTAGVLFYQLATDTNSVAIGGSNLRNSGMVYAPSAAISWQGSNAIWLLVVGDTVTLTGGNTAVPATASSPLPGSRHVVLGE